MQNQQAGRVGDYVTPTTAKSGTSLGEKLKMAGAGGLLLVAGVVGAFTYFKSQKNVVLFENSTDQAGELSLNGKSYGSLPPHQHLRVELDAASYTLSFAAGATKLDEGTLVVPEHASGLGTVGYRAVYNLGGRKGLAVVTKYYGGSLKDSVVPFESSKRLVEVPRAELANVDETFPKSISVKKGQSYGSVVLVCHVDEEKETVGCPGW